MKKPWRHEILILNPKSEEYYYRLEGKKEFTRTINGFDFDIYQVWELVEIIGYFC